MARILHAMAVLGYLGPAGLSVASNYLAVLSELVAERGAELAIAYDRELRRHLKSEAVSVSEVAPYLNTLNDARAAALRRMFHNEETERAIAARRPAPAAGGKGAGGKGNKGTPSGRDRGNNHRDRNHDRNRNRPEGRDRPDKRPRGN